MRSNLPKSPQEIIRLIGFREGVINGIFQKQRIDAAPELEWKDMLDLFQLEAEFNPRFGVLLGAISADADLKPAFLQACKGKVLSAGVKAIYDFIETPDAAVAKVDADQLIAALDLILKSNIEGRAEELRLWQEKVTAELALKILVHLKNHSPEKFAEIINGSVAKKSLLELAIEQKNYRLIDFASENMLPDRSLNNGEIRIIAVADGIMPQYLAEHRNLKPKLEEKNTEIQANRMMVFLDNILANPAPQNIEQGVNAINHPSSSGIVQSLVSLPNFDRSYTTLEIALLKKYPAKIITALVKKTDNISEIFARKMADSVEEKVTILWSLIEQQNVDAVRYLLAEKKVNPDEKVTLGAAQKSNLPIAFAVGKYLATYEQTAILEMLIKCSPTLNSAVGFTACYNSFLSRSQKINTPQDPAKTKNIEKIKEAFVSRKIDNIFAEIGRYQKDKNDHAESKAEDLSPRLEKIEAEYESLRAVSPNLDLIEECKAQRKLPFLLYAIADDTKLKEYFSAKSVRINLLFSDEAVADNDPNRSTKLLFLVETLSSVLMSDQSPDKEKISPFLKQILKGKFPNFIREMGAASEEILGLMQAAIYAGDLQVIQELLESKVPLNTQDFVLAMAKNPEIFNFLLSSIDSAAHQNMLLEVLRSASFTNNHSVIDVLLSGKYFNETSKEGIKALLISCDEDVFSHACSKKNIADLVEEPEMAEIRICREDIAYIRTIASGFLSGNATKTWMEEQKIIMRKGHQPTLNILLNNSRFECLGQEQKLLNIVISKIDSANKESVSDFIKFLLDKGVRVDLERPLEIKPDGKKVFAFEAFFVKSYLPNYVKSSQIDEALQALIQDVANISPCDLARKEIAAISNICFDNLKIAKGIRSEIDQFKNFAKHEFAKAAEFINEKETKEKLAKPEVLSAEEEARRADIRRDKAAKKEAKLAAEKPEIPKAAEFLIVQKADNNVEEVASAPAQKSAAKLVKSRKQIPMRQVASAEPEADAHDSAASAAQPDSSVPKPPNRKQTKLHKLESAAAQQSTVLVVEVKGFEIRYDQVEKKYTANNRDDLVVSYPVDQSLKLGKKSATLPTLDQVISELQILQAEDEGKRSEFFRLHIKNFTALQKQSNPSSIPSQPKKSSQLLASPASSRGAP